MPLLNTNKLRGQMATLAEVREKSQPHPWIYRTMHGEYSIHELLDHNLLHVVSGHQTTNDMPCDYSMHLMALWSRWGPGLLKALDTALSVLEALERQGYTVEVGRDAGTLFTRGEKEIRILPPAEDPDLGGTASGRLSSRDCNITNLRKDDPVKHLELGIMANLLQSPEVLAAAIRALGVHPQVLPAGLSPVDPFEAADRLVSRAIRAELRGEKPRMRGILTDEARRELRGKKRKR